MEEQLNKLKKVQKVDAPPFLLTRIHARIKDAGLEPLPGSWLWATAFAFLGLVWLNTGALLGDGKPMGTHQTGLVAQYNLYKTEQLYADEN